MGPSRLTSRRASTRSRLLGQFRKSRVAPSRSPTPTDSRSDNYRHVVRPRVPLLAGNRGFRRSRKNDRISTRRASQEFDLGAAFRASAFVGMRDHVGVRWHGDAYAGSRSGEQDWRMSGLLATAVGAHGSIHSSKQWSPIRARTWAHGLRALGQMTLQSSSLSCRWRVPRTLSRGIGALPLFGNQTEFLELDVDEPAWD